MMMVVSSQACPPSARAVLRESAPSEASARELASLYSEHFAFVWRSARRLGVPRSAVDDAVQDVFLVAHRKLGEFAGRSSLRTWLFGITRKVARDYRRAKPSDVRDVPELDAMPAPGVGPLQQAEQAQSAELLQALLDQLDDERREAFILVDLEELSVPEAAEALGVNLNTLYSRVRAARQDLKSALTRLRARAQRSEPWNR